ncbi:GNAT family N-acetyltransferase [Streptosporangiaceae bacterium NEAU-GS5]|nr:GNAT family N-acetyltransferase [Streptosporangiaceae bacterium NEAU-GS5]
MFDEHLTIKTERLVLRPFRRDDARRVRRVLDQGEYGTALPPGAPGHPSGIAQWLSDGVHELRRSGQGIHLAMETGGEIVGAISLFKTQWGAGTTEVGYGVHTAHRGRGYAPEAVRGLAAWALGEGGLRRIELRANMDNTASIRVAEKAGFTREGVLRSGGFEDDGPHDLAVFGLLRDDVRTGFDSRLDGEHLLLRPFGKRDAFDVLSAVRGDGEIARWMVWAQDYSLEKAVDWCVRYAFDGDGVNYAIEPRGSERLAGAIGVGAVDYERRDAEIGYWLAPWARGRGYATEATRMVAAHLFERGMHRVHLIAAIGNRASQAVARRAGFIEEGILRRSLPVPEGWADGVIFGLLHGEL